jgi:hypothetical protein
MPTGYTAAIKDGISFTQFAMRCARGMGALVTMRDEPLDAPVPEKIEPSPYHLEKLEKLRATLAELRAMPVAEIAAAAVMANAERAAAHQRDVVDNEDRRSKYEEMLRQVEKWEPPTHEHRSLRTFMIEQIEQSISFDCRDLIPPPKPLTGPEWIETKLRDTLRDIEYHETKHTEEVAMAASRTQWLRALRASLPATE